MAITVVERSVVVNYVPHKAIIEQTITEDGVTYEYVNKARPDYKAALLVPAESINYAGYKKTNVSKIYIPTPLNLLSVELVDIEMEDLRYVPYISQDFKFQIEINDILLTQITHETQLNLPIYANRTILASVDTSPHVTIKSSLDSERDIRIKATVKLQYDSVYTELVEINTTENTDLIVSPNKFSF